MRWGLVIFNAILLMQNNFFVRSKDFQIELTHLLGNSSSCSSTRMFQGSLLKLFRESNIDRVSRIEEGGGNDGVTVTHDNSRHSIEYEHSKVHHDSNIVAHAMKIAMPPDAPNQRVLVAFDVEATYQQVIAILAVLKNAYAVANVSMHLSHPRLLEMMKVIKPAIVLVDEVTMNNYGHIFDQYVTQASVDGAIPPLFFSIDKEIEGMEHLHKVLSRDHLESKAVAVGMLSPETFPLDSEAMFVFTSGSTGIPKIACYSFRKLLQGHLGEPYTEVFKSSKSVVLTEGLHSMGGITCFTACVVYGAVCTLALFDETHHEPETYENILEMKVDNLLLNQDVTAIIGPPFYFDIIMEEVEDNQLQSVEVIFTYGAAMSTSRLNGLVGNFPNANIFSIYGSSEANTIAYSNILEEPDEFTIREGVEARITPPYSTDGSGRLVIRTNTMMLGYVVPTGYHMPVDADGWYSTGDNARLLDNNNKLVLHGRNRPSINFAGEELDPVVVASNWKTFFLESAITYKDDLVVIRDLQHSVYEQTAVVFFHWQTSEHDLSSNSTLLFTSERLASIKRVLTDAKKRVDAKKSLTIEKQSFWGTSAICFVDDFPRTGTQRKISVSALEKMYNNEIKPRVLSLGHEGDSDSHLLALSLHWNSSAFEIHDWREMSTII